MLTLPRNVWILAITLALVMSSAPLLIFVGSLLARHIAPDKNLATLPTACFIIGAAAFTLPAGWFFKTLGRKNGAYVGMSLSFFGALLCALAAYSANFYVLIGGAFFLGSGTAFFQQFRFAAIESVSAEKDIGSALSVIMLSGIFAAFIGPEIGTVGRNLIGSPHGYVGSFLLLAGCIVLGMCCFAFFKNPKPQSHQEKGEERRLFVIIRQPVFLVALLGAAIGYGVMSFLMTSTPISMHELNGHSLMDAKWVIQSHLMAMFLPSLFSGVLLKRFGPEKLMLTGSVLYILVIVVGLMGQHFLHFWWALVLLGVGWNFLFVSATAILPRSYQFGERFKVQADNDFTVFVIQAAASLSAGWVLFQLGWLNQILLCIPIVILMCVVSLVYLVMPGKNSVRAVS